MSYRAPMNGLGWAYRGVTARGVTARGVTARVIPVHAPVWGAAGLGRTPARDLFAGMMGLGQTKPGAPDHTAQDVSTGLTTAGTIAASIITATQGGQTATPPAGPVAPYVEPSATEWYWPVLGAVGVLGVIGVAFMVTKKPKAKAATANRSKRRSRKNGWRRRSSRGLKGKRRSRAKRAYPNASIAEMPMRDGKRTSRRNPPSRVAEKHAAFKALVRAMEAGDPVSIRTALAAYEATGDHSHGRGPIAPGGPCGHGDDCIVRQARAMLASVASNGRRRSRPNQTFYYNPRLSKKRRTKLPASKFVFPKDRAWPIESAQGARDAIKYIRMGRVRNAGDYMAIRSFIMKHYPAVWRKDGLGTDWLTRRRRSTRASGIGRRRGSWRTEEKVMAKKRTSRKPKRGSRKPVRRNPAEIKPDWRLVKLDERQHWRDDIKAMTTEIFGVYAYDKNKHVHVAEITPSYELTFIDFDYGETPKVADDDDLREQLNEMILEGKAEQESGTYMHVRDLDALLKKHPKRGRSIPKLDEPDPDATDREQEQAVLDEIMERWNGGGLYF